MTTQLTRLTPAALDRLAAGTADRKEAEETRALIAQNPVGALTVVEGRSLKLWQSANLLDEVVGQFGDPDQARQLVEDHVSEGVQEELLAVRSDLPSSAAYVLSPERLLGAIMRDMGAGDDILAAQAMVLEAWAHKLKERGDWPEILEMEVDGLSVADLILLAIQAEHERDGELTPDVFEACGLDYHEGLERLAALKHDGVLLEELDVEFAMKRLGSAREAAKEVSTLAEAAARAAKTAAEEGDL